MHHPGIVYKRRTCGAQAANHFNDMRLLAPQRKRPYYHFQLIALLSDYKHSFQLLPPSFFLCIVLLSVYGISLRLSQQPELCHGHSPPDCLLVGEPDTLSTALRLIDSFHILKNDTCRVVQLPVASSFFLLCYTSHKLPSTSVTITSS